MKRLLVINASGRQTRSITRHLTARYADHWTRRHPDGEVTVRDVGTYPPPPVNETWIASAFTPVEQRDATMRQALDTSERLLGELEGADEVVIGIPLYNFGMPAQLKAYFDQIIRVNRSFLFDASAPEPYQPLLRDRPVTVAISAGDGELLPGGSMAHLNFLEPHLVTMLNFVGITSVRFVRAGYEEYQDARLATTLSAAEKTIDRYAGPAMPAEAPERIP